MPGTATALAERGIEQKLAELRKGDFVLVVPLKRIERFTGSEFGRYVERDDRDLSIEVLMSFHRRSVNGTPLWLPGQGGWRPLGDTLYSCSIAPLATERSRLYVGPEEIQQGMAEHGNPSYGVVEAIIAAVQGK